jgi:hypothetical protein
MRLIVYSRILYKEINQDCGPDLFLYYPKPKSMKKLMLLTETTLLKIKRFYNNIVSF